ncbi:MULTISPECIES: anaerobic ribonucleoside-triphosphate reductase activating protein [Paenibacillus]|uniref:Anaerobic ribonucleoside-triphosphate reductase-activating protein n=1 Tax=Paenibacillus albilobatus TaxID=2716884 RepID=A0A919XCE4_9BACL|nr:MULTISPECIES: anaerobic ribonucleoside-triphosphate reductase activating protein [Paenibacillus]GIO30077.1 anaerobic ribonucleoside-triphosphate reductase-activating protein [Paenibacillus albilobatus]
MGTETEFVPAFSREGEATVWIMDIVHDSVVDGEGLRTVIFCAGCPHRCAGCHNPESWKLRSGRRLSIAEVVREAGSNPLTDITLSGGDPFLQARGMSLAARELKGRGKHIWAYTGYTLEELLASGDRHKQELLDCCGVLVDGRFQLEQRDLSIPFRGSRNQRIWARRDGGWEEIYPLDPSGRTSFILVT